MKCLVTSLAVSIPNSGLKEFDVIYLHRNILTSGLSEELNKVSSECLVFCDNVYLEVVEGSCHFVASDGVTSLGSKTEINKGESFYMYFESEGLITIKVHGASALQKIAKSTWFVYDLKDLKYLTNLELIYMSHTDMRIANTKDLSMLVNLKKIHLRTEDDYDFTGNIMDLCSLTDCSRFGFGSGRTINGIFEDFIEVWAPNAKVNICTFTLRCVFNGVKQYIG